MEYDEVVQLMYTLRYFYQIAWLLSLFLCSTLHDTVSAHDLFLFGGMSFSSDFRGRGHHKIFDLW
jgi:hypothetical protein